MIDNTKIKEVFTKFSNNHSEAFFAVINHEHENDRRKALINYSEELIQFILNDISRNSLTFKKTL